MSEYEAVFAASVKPLVAQFKELDGRVATAEAELAEMKALRNRIKAAVKLLAPEALPSKNGASRKKRGIPPREEERLGVAMRWLENHVEPGGEFFASWLVERAHWVYSPSQTAKILTALHEREQIHVARVGRGGRRIYKVVR